MEGIHLDGLLSQGQWNDVEIVDSGSSTVQTPNLQITKQLFQNYTPVTDTATNLCQQPQGGQLTAKDVASAQAKIVMAND